jgi:uncharacterized membrane protein YqgA involved in biofilm formation
MLGTITNALAVVFGGLLGLGLCRGLSEKYKLTVQGALGLCIVFIGVSGAVKNMINPDANPFLFILSLAAGGFLGEKLGIEEKMEILGQRLERRFASGQDGAFAKGFVSGSLLFCVGSMGILGSIEDGIRGAHDILFAKAVIDGILAMILASALGVGVLFSGISVFIYQGAITVTASLIAPFISDAMLLEIGIAGGILISAIGFNMLGVTKIKVGNLLPGILGPVIYFLALRLFQ